MAVWVGLFIAFYTPYPVSFFITAIVFSLYILVRLVALDSAPRSYPTTAKEHEVIWLPPDKNYGVL